MDNSKRAGFFTSSQMSRLAASLKSGEPSAAYGTYVQEVAAERAMGRVISTDVKTQPIKWGSLMENVVFDHLGLGYKMTHKMTVVHPDFENSWSGTADLVAEKIKIGEIKCFQPKNFALLSMCLMKKDVGLLKSDFPKEYWQCVSNAILHRVDRAELIAFMPTKSELEEIIEKIDQTNFLEERGLDPADYYFMGTETDIGSLPYLPDDSPMRSINQFEFDIPEIDVDFLTGRVKMASDSM